MNKLDLYKEYLKSKVEYTLYANTYNCLIDISKMSHTKVKYLIGPEYNICKKDEDPVKRSNCCLNENQHLFNEYKNKIENIKEEDIDISEEDMNKYINEHQVSTSKFNAMFVTLKEISSAQINRLSNGWFDSIYCYFYEDTIEKAKKCLDRIKQYMD